MVGRVGLIFTKPAIVVIERLSNDSSVRVLFGRTALHVASWRHCESAAAPPRQSRSFWQGPFTLLAYMGIERSWRCCYPTTPVSRLRPKRAGPLFIMPAKMDTKRSWQFSCPTMQELRLPTRMPILLFTSLANLDVEQSSKSCFLISKGFHCTISNPFFSDPIATHKRNIVDFTLPWFFKKKSKSKRFGSSMIAFRL